MGRGLQAAYYPLPPPPTSTSILGFFNPSSKYYPVISLLLNNFSEKVVQFAPYMSLSKALLKCEKIYVSSINVRALDIFQGEAKIQDISWGGGGKKPL